ncbi:hypothetical protein C9I36_17065 [Pectobacterium punjabense]|nr:hypothetical protein C9I36_17065 [Pectobacterium punjabense]
MGLALKGRCKQRSNLLPADLSPESLTCVSSSGFPLLPPSCNSNYLGYIDLDYALIVWRIFPSINVI